MSKSIEERAREWVFDHVQIPQGWELSILAQFTDFARTIEREVIERCAKIADEAQSGYAAGRLKSESFTHAAMDYGLQERVAEKIAAAIRALAEKDDEPYRAEVTTGMSEGGIG